MRMAARSFSDASKVRRPKNSSCTASLVLKLRRRAGRLKRSIARSSAFLEAEGGSFGSVVAETAFHRNLRANVVSVREARDRVIAGHGEKTQWPATTEIEQPPLNERACLEVSLQAVLPNESPARFERVEARPACGCAECAGAHGLRFHVGGEVRFQAAGLCGPGNNAYEQTLGMFGLAEACCSRPGWSFAMWCAPGSICAILTATTKT
jgi:hypothetical protein